MDQERFSNVISFILQSGEEVWPVQMKNRVTGLTAFRISPGGTGGNKLTSILEVTEKTMFDKVRNEAWAVRCAPKSGGHANLYKIGLRAVREVRLHTT
jgi:hypothetical protein